jgi:hypothetical protein
VIVFRGEPRLHVRGGGEQRRGTADGVSVLPQDRRHAIHGRLVELGVEREEDHALE